jgi:hypothetical protein
MRWGFFTNAGSHIFTVTAKTPTPTLPLSTRGGGKTPHHIDLCSSGKMGTPHRALRYTYSRNGVGCYHWAFP